MVCLLCASMVSVMAQRQAKSQKLSFHVVREVKPAILNLVEGTIRFEDATGNQAIDASEHCKLTFQVQNNGMGVGIGCVAKLKATGTLAGISTKDVHLPPIAVGATQTVEIPIISYMNTEDGNIAFTLQVDEPNGFGTDPVTLNINTRAFESPFLQVTDHTITGSLSTTLEKKKPFDLQILLQNTKYGMAENVSVDIQVPNGVFVVGGEQHTSIPQMPGGQQKSLVYSLIVNNNYTGSTVPIRFFIHERYGKYAESKTIELALNQTFSASKIDVKEIKEERQEIEIATLKSGVDKDIPTNPANNDNTFAFIIANEKYQNQNFAAVPHAQNDGNVFASYCHKTLGIPERNIHVRTNATYAQMRQLIQQLTNTANVNPHCKIIFYYAGHGAPNEATKEAYLIPVDAYQVGDLCLSLQTLYDDFKALTDSRITVFLDACFSGANRDNKMVAAARGVAIAPKQNVVEGNLVVFSAATGDETAWPYKEESHGMFTYFLLKKLQETKGEVTYQDLHDYLYQNVRRQSNNVNGKIQTPTISSSPNLGDSWQKWKLK